MRNEKRNSTNINISPNINTNRLDQVSGVGGSVNINSKSTHTTVGVQTSRNTTTIFGRSEREFSDSTSVHAQGSVDNHGNYHAGVGIKFKF